MHFSEIKKSIQEDLLSRNLKNPAIRINAIESVESLLKQKLEEMLSDPTKLLELIDKDELKNMLSKLKHNGRINDAESSVINEMYYRITN